jgi:hypothetical protein
MVRFFPVPSSCDVPVVESGFLQIEIVITVSPVSISFVRVSIVCTSLAGVSSVFDFFVCMDIAVDFNVFYGFIFNIE